MKFSFSWLKHYLETDADITQLADALNRVGLEVEGIENPAEALAPFRVAEILEANPHPQADKLQVLRVDLGDGEPLQIVCGAPNARAGMKGILGISGATVPSNGMVLKPTEIRGVESNGMMCSLAELDLGEDHDGIAELPDDAPVGKSYADYAGLDDPVIDVSVTPNKQDCMGVMGIARDLAAAGLGEFKPPLIPEIKALFPCPTEIRTDDPDGCPAFHGCVIRGVKNGPSPDWMQARLKSAGQKPINALVDCTNYLMFACGRPAHVYDLKKLNGAVVARRAKDGETITALNEKEYTLTSDITVIADDAGVHDIAGIMGGIDSGCNDETTDVLLEIAYFTPERIAKTGQALSLASDARTRFERGVDPAFLNDGLTLLTDLILQICGGEASEAIAAGEAPLSTKTVAYDPSLSANLGGMDVSHGEQKNVLESLGFVVDADWNISVPTWRRDIDGPADLVEEIIRMVGIDKVKSVPLPRQEGVAKPTATPMQKLERKIRRKAASLGFNEAINWSFISEKEAAAVGGGAWSLANPISEDMKVMRPSLLPGLLSAVRRNFDRGASSVRMFELGRRYLSDGEHPTLVFVMAGEKNPRSWQNGKPQYFDAYDAKSMARALLASTGVDINRLMTMEADAGHYHPGQSATLRMGPKNILASFGVIHPSTAKIFGIDAPIVAAGIHLDAIPAKKGKKSAANFMRPHYAPPALQAVNRDFAFIVPEDLEAGNLVAAIRSSDKKNIAAVRIFDRFAGGNLPEGKISLAAEVKLQPTDKSYTDEDLQAISDKVVAAAAKTGAELRG